MRQPDPAYSSALARELSRVPVSLRKRFGVPDLAIPVIDVVVGIVRAILESDGEAEMEARLEAVMSRLEGEFSRAFSGGPPSDARLKAWERWFKLRFNVESLDAAEITAKADRFMRMTKSGKKFWMRLLGAAHYRRLTAALAEDGGLLLLAGRRLARYIMPVAVAMDDLALVIPDAKRATLKGVPLGERTFLDLLYGLDSVIDDFVDKRGIPFENLPLREDEGRAFDANLDVLISTLRASLESETLERTSELSDVLSRKLQGFTDALSQSADGVSQAANSLVEYIDRLLRGSFSDDEVLAWIEAHRADEKDELVYVDKASGKSRPTKLGHALCFAHAGQEPPTDGDGLNRMAAVGLVEVRRQAEKLKHSDDGTPEEAERLQELMNATRGYFMFSIRLSWALIDKSRFEGLRDRFRKAA